MVTVDVPLASSSYTTTSAAPAAAAFSTLVTKLQVPRLTSATRDVAAAPTSVTAAHASTGSVVASPPVYWPLLGSMVETAGPNSAGVDEMVVAGEPRDADRSELDGTDWTAFFAVDGPMTVDDDGPLLPAAKSTASRDASSEKSTSYSA